METRRWTNPTQPQTLQYAVFLLYINAVFTAILGGLASPLGIALVVGAAAGGFGIANEKRWGYKLGIAMAFLPFLLRMAILGVDSVLGGSIINLMFEVALVALLLHPHSREYQKIWFS
ncbi:MAG TPA: hypothetical protein VM262_08015 [Acidimicrobiales bacterium]|nr:hypothetical protein [Acidimicrobiales bacterium]